MNNPLPFLTPNQTLPAHIHAEHSTRLSRQRIAQLRNQSRGLCTCCSRPSPHRRLCDVCATRQAGGKIKRHLTETQWKAADWSLNNKQLAAALGVTRVTVTKHREIYAPHTTAAAKGHAGRPRLHATTPPAQLAA